MKNFKDKRKIQSGRSMIEMLGVLAIVGVLSAGGIAGYSMAMQSHKTNTLIEKIQLISLITRNVCKGNYTNISKDTLINTGKLKAADFQNPFGGTLSVVAWSDTDYFYINGNGIPADPCVEIVQTDWGSSGVYWGVSVYGKANFSYQYGGLPVSTSDAINTCKSGNNDISLIFK